MNLPWWHEYVDLDGHWHHEVWPDFSTAFLMANTFEGSTMGMCGA